MTVERGKMLSLEYIRETYNVPAYSGGRICYDGYDGPQYGTITSGSGPYIRVRFDGRKITVRLHPTWKVRYLDAQGKSGGNDG